MKKQSDGVSEASGRKKKDDDLRKELVEAAVAKLWEKHEEEKYDEDNKYGAEVVTRGDTNEKEDKACKEECEKKDTIWGAKTRRERVKRGQQIHS